MVRKVIDITGKTFNRWTVLSLSPSRGSDGGAVWVCKCECGTVASVSRNNLVSGKSKCCGCFKDPVALEVRSSSMTTHGKSGTSEYITWARMIQMCTNENYSAYHRYGGRGIDVCDSWKQSFENFYRDVGPKPVGSFKLMRKDNDKDFAPGNCHWVRWD